MQNKRTIAFLFPGICHKPVGGTKIVLEYANRIANSGYDVHIILEIPKPIPTTIKTAATAPSMVFHAWLGH